MEDNERPPATAAYNAAQAFARTGQTAIALNHLDIAIALDAMHERAEALRKRLSPPRER